MYKYVVIAAASALAAMMIFAAASASATEDAMREGGYTLAPLSFVKFCLDYPDECPKSASPARVSLTSERLSELSAVNRAVNVSIRAQPDASALHYWKLDVKAGDCNAFAVQKRHELLQRGWPAAALALTVAKTRSGEGHLVVTVRTDQGDLVLDNLRPTIVSWRETGYEWIMRQSAGNPRFWVELNGGRAEPGDAAQALKDAPEATAADGGTAIHGALALGQPTSMEEEDVEASMTSLARWIGEKG